MKIAAVIPTRFHPPELAVLRGQAAADGVDLYVIESQLFEHRIYRMWNAGVALARGAGATHVAILSDDVRLLAGALPLMAAHFDPHLEDVAVVYPNAGLGLGAGQHKAGMMATEGTWGSGGMTGFCFMFRTDADLPEFDEDYGWWYGDDAWEEAVRSRYKVCRALGVPIEHTPNGSAGRVWSDLEPLIVADRVRWEHRHLVNA